MAELTQQDVRELVAAELAKQRDGQRLPASWKLESLAWMAGIIVGLSAIAAVGLSSWVASIVRTEVEEIIQTDNEEGFEALADAVVVEFEQRRGFVDRVSTQVLPAGSVITVDNRNGCPRGWVAHQASQGRFIIGVGGQEGLIAKPYGQVGGSETHTLTIAEMPEHAHTMLWGRTDIQSEGRKAVGNDVRSGLPARDIQSTLSNGEGRSHNNMPPYIALYFCKKEG